MTTRTKITSFLQNNISRENGHSLGGLQHEKVIFLKPPLFLLSYPIHLPPPPNHLPYSNQPLHNIHYIPVFLFLHYPLIVIGTSIAYLNLFTETTFHKPYFIIFARNHEHIFELYSKVLDTGIQLCKAPKCWTSNNNIYFCFIIKCNS